MFRDENVIRRSRGGETGLGFEIRGITSRLCYGFDYSKSWIILRARRYVLGNVRVGEYFM